MRAGPAFRSSFFVLSAGSVGLGCFLNSSAYDAGGASGTTTSTSSTSMTTTTTSQGGAGGNTVTTTTPMGGTGGNTVTSSGGGGTGGATGGGGTGGVPMPTSCLDALAKGVIQSGVVTIDPDTPEFPEPSMNVYCDQVNMGGGWALVFSSVGDPAGQTTAFWNIPYAQRFDVLGDAAAPAPAKNYYAGRLYKYGTEYRDDLVDVQNVESIGIVHAKATSIDMVTMHFMGFAKYADNVSDDLYGNQFASGWSSPDHDDDGDASNCAAKWANVTQHYGGCWYYSLGADTEAVPGSNPPDYSDSGWGPHVSNATLGKINTALQNVGKPVLHDDGNPDVTASSRLGRITRFARW